MDRKLFDMIDEEMPKFNPMIANGLAVYQVPKAEEFIDQIFACISRGFPAGLKYEGYQRCTPQEEYNEITNKRGTKRYCEISRSDMYLVKYKLSFEGKMLYPRYLYLPFVNDAGIIAMRGSTFQVVPILADRIISVEHDSIFIVLNCAKLKFERVVQHYVANRETETVNVVWAPIHNEFKKKKGSDRPVVDACTSLAHYLFARFGIVETFRKFTGADIKIGEGEINETTYPPDQWVICSTSGIKPAKLKEKVYFQSPIRLAIPVKDYNQINRELIGGLFYVLDHFPERFRGDNFNIPEEQTLWKILLGHLIFAAGSGEGDLCNKVEDHFSSLDEYIDEMDYMTLTNDGIHCDNIYSLFIHIIETMPERLMNVGSSVASLYDKQLTILRYLLFDIRSAIVKVRFKLFKANGKRPLISDDINKVLNRELPREIIAGINRNHGEVTSISSPGDNKILKITSNIVMQTKSGGNSKKKSRSNISDPSKALHSSNAEVSSFCNLPQSDPTGRSRINLTVKLSEDGTVIRNEKFRPLLDQIQYMIDR